MKLNVYSKERLSCSTQHVTLLQNFSQLIKAIFKLSVSSSLDPITELFAWRQLYP